MKTHTSYLTFNTKRRQEIIDITDEVENCRAAAHLEEGIILVSAMHISASVFVNDHEPGLWQDILDWLEKDIAPWDPDRYRHNAGTGEDNAAAHLRSLTIGHEVIVPVTAGRLDLGPWQRIFYGEWDGRRPKRVILKAMANSRPPHADKRCLELDLRLVSRTTKFNVCMNQRQPRREPTRSQSALVHRGPGAHSAPQVTAPLHHAPNAALLIDFDNVTMGIRSDLGKELRNLLSSDIIKGKVAVQRAYADWRRYPQYIVPLTESSIDLIYAPAHGANKKNATDIRLAIDALELVFTRPEIGTFILLSGDSDFSSLVLKLKEYGKYVIGVGIRESSSDLLIQNCDEYYSYNELAGLTKESDVTHPRHDPWDLVIEAVKQMTAHSDVMRSDRLKQVMQEIDPAFNEKDLGFSRFSKFVVEAAHKGLLALTKLDNGQYEIGLGAGVPGAAAQPSGMGSFDRPRERERSEGRGRGRRGRGGSQEGREGR